MSKSVSHTVSTREPYITPRGDIGRGLIRHVMQILTCNVHKIWLHKIKINHKNKTFTVDFSDFWNCYGCI
jgi:hypothetical protein